MNCQKSTTTTTTPKTGITCPKCSSSRLRRNGTDHSTSSKSQKYICLTCGHNFRDYDRLAARFQRMIVVADNHSGHQTGLTPPEFENPSAPHYEFRREVWNWFYNVINQMKPFDVALFNGDTIDGSQKKSGGMELLVNDRFKQVQMATQIARLINADKNIVVRGTKYHVGSEENFEDLFAENIGTHARDHFIGDIGGKVFDVRHKIGRSGVPYGRVTPLSRQLIWSRLREERTGVHADVIIRSHVHYRCLIEENGIIALTTHALQGHSAYGAQECDGETDLGLDIFDIYPDGRILIHKFTPVLTTNKIVVEKI